MPRDPNVAESLAVRNMLHVYRMLSLFDPVFARMAEGLPVRHEDIAKMKYHVPDDSIPSAERQIVLRECLSIVAVPVRGQFPFSGKSLSRADICWLLSNVTGTLDLRGADLSGADLRRLDLTGAMFGLSIEDGEQCVVDAVISGSGRLTDAARKDAAKVQLRKADLNEARLSGVALCNADIRDALLMGADLSGADLSEANLRGAQLHYAKLVGASIRGADLVGTNFSHADMRRCSASNANLVDAQLINADLGGAYLSGAKLGGAVLSRAHLDGASDLSGVSFIDAVDEAEEQRIRNAGREASRYMAAFLADVDWGSVNLTGIDWSHLTFVGEEGDLRSRRRQIEKVRKAKKRLAEVEGQLRVLKPIETLDRIKRDYMEGEPLQPRSDLTDDEWKEVESALKIVQEGSPLVEEELSLTKFISDEQVMFPSRQLGSQRDSARAYRQLANCLRSQGLITDSGNFAYRALKLQRRVPRRERQLYHYSDSSPDLGRFRAIKERLVDRMHHIAEMATSEAKVFGSFLVDIVCGYGYRPARAIFAYATTVAAFALGYAAGGMKLLPDALVFSVTSFHGRGFTNLLGPASGAAQVHIVEIAAGEAFIGLLMEVVLVATFTRRLFER